MYGGNLGRPRCKQAELLKHVKEIMCEGVVWISLVQNSGGNYLLSFLKRNNLPSFSWKLFLLYLELVYHIC
jgi:hypothetical protein